MLLKCMRLHITKNANVIIYIHAPDKILTEGLTTYNSPFACSPPIKFTLPTHTIYFMRVFLTFTIVWDNIEFYT